MNQQKRGRAEIEADSNWLVFWTYRGNYLSFLIEKEYPTTVAPEKESLPKSNKTFFYWCLLIGLLSLQLFAFTQLPKMITLFQEVVLEEAKPTWGRK